jgi:lipopolysaccharide transport system ATP-binding protein
MNDVAIRAEGLSKLYRIGQREKYYTLRDTLMSLLKAPLSACREESGNGDRSTLWALKDVSFEIKRGEVVGVIGRNGAGKTTLLKILSRITEPTEGYAEINGRVGSLLEVGTGFHPELTGRENIYLNGTILGMKKKEIDRRFDEIVSFAEVGKFIDTPVKHYSSGMHMRLAFAVASHLETEILLIDEVLAVGDAAFQRKCLGKMDEMTQRGRTVLFVSHNLAAIRSLCKNVFLLSDGRLLFSGVVGAGIDRYLVSISTEMIADMNTSNLPRPAVVTGEQTLRITRIRLGTELEQAILRTGRPMTLVLEFTVFRPVREVVLAWSVHVSDHIRLFECQSGESVGVGLELQPGDYRVQCVVPQNPLNPGLYTLHVGARCATKGLDYLPNVITFRVDSTARYDSLWLEAPSGILRVPSSWSSPVQSHCALD